MTKRSERFIAFRRFCLKKKADPQWSGSDSLLWAAWQSAWTLGESTMTVKIVNGFAYDGEHLMSLGMCAEEIERLQELQRKERGKANEINILVKENRQQLEKIDSLNNVVNYWKTRAGISDEAECTCSNPFDKTPGSHHSLMCPRWTSMRNQGR